MIVNSISETVSCPFWLILGQLGSLPELSSLVLLRLFRSGTSGLTVARGFGLSLSTVAGAAGRQASTPGQEGGAQEGDRASVPQKNLRPAARVHVSVQTA